MRKTIAAASLLLAAVMAVPSGAAERVLRPLVLGWEQFFKIDWQVSEGRRSPIVWGHLMNDWGMPAGRVQLLVEGLDGSGQIVGQKIAWLGSTLTPGTRAYFEVPVTWKAPTHRVSVFAFEWIQSNGDTHP